MNRRILGIVTLSGAALVLAGAAPAQQAITVVKTPDGAAYLERVSYADLDLSQDAARQLLMQRVGSAITSVCRLELGPSPIYQAEASCRQWAWRRSRPQVERAVANRLAGGTSLASAAQIVVTSQ